MADTESPETAPVSAASDSPGAAAPHRTPAALRIVRRIPVTLGLVLVVLIVGVAGRGLWTPTEEQSWYPAVAFGLPAFDDGHWWSPLSGTFFVAQPLGYIGTILSFVGMGYVEWRRGSRVAGAYFAGGQLAAVLLVVLFLTVAAPTGWPWAVELSRQLDVGPSGGTMACIAAAAGLLPSPWRQRAWLAVLAWVLVGALFIGTLADLEHVVAVVVVLIIDRSLGVRLATVRERRSLAVAGAVVLGGLKILTLLAPTSGPFGTSRPLSGPWVDVLIDVVVIAVMVNGLRRGRRWAWVITVVYGALNVVVAVLYVVLAVSVPGFRLGPEVDIDVALAASALWGVFVGYLVAARGAFRGRGRLARRVDRVTRDHEEARAIIHAHGGGSLSWMAVWDGIEYLRTARGLVPFQEHGGVAIALADPLGPADSIEESTREFIRVVENDSRIPCFFSASEATRDAVPASWRSLIIADDTLVDLPGLAFTGKAWSQVRTAINRAEREGVTFRMTTLGEVTWGVRQQLRALSESWVDEKDLPEMRFTLGTLHEADDSEVRLALAMTADGDVDGFLSWLPVYGPDGVPTGWTLDLMRRRDGGFGPVMEFLIGCSARLFAEEGALTLSLSGAPLAHVPGPGEGRIARLLGRLAALLEPVYGFSSLHRFKQKFNPRYEPIYLLYRDEGDLARIAAGLTRAFLPDATLRQFAGAGLDMVRSR